MTLDGKKALVTGGAKRIGKAIAVALAKEGCDVVIHYNESKTDADTTVSEIQGLGRKVTAIQGDFMDADLPARLAKEATFFLGGLDILVNNASYWPYPETFVGHGGLRVETVYDWERSMNVNARAPFFLIQACAAALTASHGVVVNLADSSVRKPFLTRAAHSVSKDALMSISRVAAKSLAPDVHVVAFAPNEVLPAAGLVSEKKDSDTWTGVETFVEAIVNEIKTRRS